MFVYMFTTQLNSVPAVPTFAEQVRGASKLNRHVCLNLKKSDLKKYEIVELLIDMFSPTSKIPNWNCRHERPKCRCNALNEKKCAGII